MMLSLSSLDKWKDLHHEVQRRLYLKKARGAKEISEKEFDLLRASCDVNFAVDKHRKESWQPVLATSEPPLASFQYATEPEAADVRRQRSLAFHLVGIDAFLERDLAEVDFELKKQVADLMRETYATLNLQVEQEVWEEIRLKIGRFYRIHPALNRDPQVLYCLGMANQALKKFANADKLFAAAARELQETSYPARFAVDVHAASVSNQKYCLQNKTPGLRLAEYYLAVVYWLENDFRASPEDHRSAYAMVNRFIQRCVSEAEWELLPQFMEDLSKNSHLPKWLKAMCRGRINRELAWRWRGTGYANTVSKENWKRFKQYQKIAAEEFEKAYDANPMFPEAAAQLITISLTGHNEKSVEYWFEKAVEAQVDYMPAYRSRLVSLLPQWGGSVQEMFDFARLHAEKEQYDTIVPMVLVEFHHKVLRRVVDHEERKLLQDPEVATATIKAIDGVLACRTSQASNSVLQDESYFVTLKAILATKGQLYDVARESFELLGDEFNSLALEDLKVDSASLLRGKAYAMSSEHAAECKEMLDVALADGDELSGEAKAEIVDRCSVLLEKVEHRHAVTWLTAIRDKLQFESEYALGMIASLPFDEGLSFWACGDRTHFKSVSTDSVMIDTSGSTKPMSLLSLVNMKGDSKIIEFDIALQVRTKNKAESSHFTPAVSVMDYRGAAFAFGLNRRYKQKRTGGNAFNLGQFSFGWKYGTGGMYFYETDISIEANRIRLKIAPGYFEAYLNDRFICRSASKHILGALDKFEICQPEGRRGRGSAVISGISIEKWYGTAPPIKDGAEKLVQYYEAEFDEDPNDKWAAYWFGHATHMSGDTERAIELYMTAIENGMAEHVAAFFLGDCHDRQGDANEAIRWYKIAADAKLEDITEIHKRSTSQNYSNSCHWAAIRLAWLMHSSPDDAVRASIKEGRFCRIGTTDKHLWVEQLIAAMGSANAGNFEKAIRLCQPLSAKCSAEDRPVLDKVLDAWRGGEEYRCDAEETPLYLRLEDPIPFFRCFEDFLNPAWKGVY